MKYFLLRPNGGLNDVLNTIWVSIEYCKKYNRTLLIDTCDINCKYRMEFHKMFEFTDDFNFKDKIITSKEEIDKIISNEDLSVYPNFLKGTLLETSYFSYWDENGFHITYQGNENKISWIKNGPIKINDKEIFEVYTLEQSVYGFKNLVEDIVVFPISLGGSFSVNLMKVLTLNDYYIDEVIKRYNILPKPYKSLHVRNTDMKTDYEDFYKKNIDLFDETPTFIATDSVLALEFFRKTGKYFINFTVPLETNYPFHIYYDDKEKMTYHTIIDMFLLALSDKFIQASPHSGFSLLTNNLHTNKKELHRILKKRLL
jgi:hypothetical protein